MINTSPQKTHNKKVQIVIVAMVLFIAGCAKEKQKDQMSAEELSTKAFAYVKSKKHDNAIGYLEQIVARYPDHENIAEYKMLLAELYFKEQKHAASQQLYDHFCQFYPADKRAEYAKYKSIMAMFYQTLQSDRDQTETDDTIRLCNEYLHNKSFNAHRKDVLDIQKSCEMRLIDKEIYVFNFYLKKGNFDAARNRLKHVKEKYLAHHNNLDARLMYLECKLAHKEKNSTLEQENITKLIQKYPTSQFTQMAQGLSHRTNFIF